MGNLEEELLNRELKPFIVFKDASEPKNVLDTVINSINLYFNHNV